MQGRVLEIHRYPVKGMFGERLNSASLDWYGLMLDRTYAFLRENIMEVSGFPWLTIRQLPALTLYRALVRDAGEEVRVLKPSGETVPVGDPKLREELSDMSGCSLRLFKLSTGTFDCESISIISRQTIHTVERDLGVDISYLRFRPNILLDFDHEYDEVSLVGKCLQFGEDDASPLIRILRRDERCSVINYDPFSTLTNPRILETVVRTMNGCAGVYGKVVRPGIVKVGDEVFTKSS